MGLLMIRPHDLAVVADMADRIVRDAVKAENRRTGVPTQTLLQTMRHHPLSRGMLLAASNHSVMLPQPPAPHPCWRQNVLPD